MACARTTMAYRVTFDVDGTELWTDVSERLYNEAVRAAMNNGTDPQTELLAILGGEKGGIASVESN